MSADRLGTAPRTTDVSLSAGPFCAARLLSQRRHVTPGAGESCTFSQESMNSSLAASLIGGGGRSFACRCPAVLFLGPQQRPSHTSEVPVGVLPEPSVSGLGSVGIQITEPLRARIVPQRPEPRFLSHLGNRWDVLKNMCALEGRAT